MLKEDFIRRSAAKHVAEGSELKDALRYAEVKWETLCYRETQRLKWKAERDSFNKKELKKANKRAMR